MKSQNICISSSTKELPCYMRESNMQGCLEFPSLVDLTTYLIGLNEESVISLGTIIYDT